MNFERRKANARAVTDLGMEKRPPPARQGLDTQQCQRVRSRGMRLSEKHWLQVFTLHTEQLGDRVPPVVR